MAGKLSLPSVYLGKLLNAQFLCLPNGIRAPRYVTPECLPVLTLFSFNNGVATGSMP